MIRLAPLLLVPLALLVGCPLAPVSSEATGVRSTPAPALGPGAGAVFNGRRALAQGNGGLQTMASWDAAGLPEARVAACKEESVELKVGVVFVVCTRSPLDGPKTGWMKVEITAEVAGSLDFRYVQWPVGGSDPIVGTGRWTWACWSPSTAPDPGSDPIVGTGGWTPSETSPSLTYTHSVDVAGTTTPEPRGPALTTPEPRAPALTTPEPTGPALTTPEPTGPALTTPEPTGPDPNNRRPPSPSATPAPPPPPSGK